jgi:hypothetical protein
VRDQIGQEAEFLELSGRVIVLTIVVDIDTVARKTDERLAVIVEWHCPIDDVAVNAVVPEATVRRLERLAELVSPMKQLEATGTILLMDPALPTIGQLLFDGPARIAQPSRVEIVTLAINSTLPDRSG